MTMRRIATILGLFMAGCATATIEDAVPPGALPPAAATAPEATAAHPDAARPPTAGTYPNLNVAPPAAAPQITAQQKAEEEAQLRARREQLARAMPGAAGAGADAATLRRLAATHGEEALREIEGE